MAIDLPDAHEAPTPGEGGAPDSGTPDSGPREALRVLEVLTALAGGARAFSLAELCHALNLPKTSLHRLLRKLVTGGFVSHQAGTYALGPESFQLASRIARAKAPTEFPACARPVIEWLARETGETVTLAVLSEQGSEMVYVDVIESESPLRFTVRTGNRRPLFGAAPGKVLLAFAAPAFQQRYLAAADFLQFTAETTRKHEMTDVLRETRQSGINFDRNGMVDGASAIAGPCFDAEGQVFCAIAVAGPTDRMEAHRPRIEALVRDGGERVSRILGFAGDWPPSA